MIGPTAMIPVALFALATVGTPGPNNVMLTASGARYGYRGTLVHIAGILGGSAVLYLGVALGLGAIFQQYALVQYTLRGLGAAYLLYLAWRIASAPPPRLDVAGDARPLSFTAAAAFQFANPKVWVMGLTLTASFLPAQGPMFANAVVLTAIMLIVGFPCLSFWATFGSVIGRMLRTNRAWRVFNIVMGALTAACVGFIIVD
ncbi:LysE family translocator [Salinisphaera hydrothermalis]|uniref:Lysine exporter protein LysE/YggA n=1 Tax=Salinisphaera hydrothermalis (strain C41B8) TaxID=1304275 RepID=A0A084IM21_SALHC|nr:LysE family translocator [Salinisphaera hydrothermalis]KEZ77755.1 lysine exporter protein LysE/YggA [Salinisphaera hydrothermalis C41B8]